MLSRTQIKDLIHVRLPEASIKEILLDLTPERTDAKTLETFLEVIGQTLPAEASAIRALGVGAVDCTGTGGSGLPHFNASTTVSFVLAAAGLKVVKCGNVGISGRSGSFDFLRALGFPVQLPMEDIPAIFAENDLVFLFAPQFYPGLAKLGPMRKALGVKTIFNFIGPLLNPARPEYRVVGVSHPAVQKLLAEYLSRTTDSNRALVVRGDNGMDELIPDGVSHLFTVSRGNITEQEYPCQSNDSGKQYQELCTRGGSRAALCHVAEAIADEAGRSRATPTSRRMQGNSIRAEQIQPSQLGPDSSAHGAELTPELNVEIFQRLLSGEDSQSRFYDMVCLNAGAAFYVANRSASIDEGFELAAELLAGGSVREKFEQCRRSYARYLA